MMIEISRRIFARVGLFPFTYSKEAAFADGSIGDPAEISESFKTANYIATLNWSVVSTDRRAFPSANYEVMICNQPSNVFESGSAFLDKFSFDEGNSYCFRPRREFTRDLQNSESGFLAVGCMVSASNSDVIVYARNATDEEISGTRVQIKANTGRPLVFFGPWIESLQASGPLTITEIYGFALLDEFLKDDKLWDPQAKVGAGKENPGIPNFPYDSQEYLQKTGLQAPEALELRLRADSLARAQRVPYAADDPLDEVVLRSEHSMNPQIVVDRLLGTTLIANLYKNLAAALADPKWSIVQANTDKKQELTVRGAGAYQLLAHLGPIEALSLGQAVSLPGKTERPEGPVMTASDAYAQLTERQLPFPLYRIAGRFKDRDSTGAEIEQVEVTVVGLDLPIEGSIATNGRTTMVRQPQDVDAAAQGNVFVEFPGGIPAQNVFAAKVSEDSKLAFLKQSLPSTDDPKPVILKSFIVGEPSKKIEPDNKTPRIDIGPVELPDGKPGSATYKVFPRDRFGRWVEPTQLTAMLDYWPIGAPTLLGADVVYETDSPLLQIRLGWDASLRKISCARIGVRLEAIEMPTPNDKPFVPPISPDRQMQRPPLPEGYNFETVPAYEDRRDFVFDIAFDEDGNPALLGMGEHATNHVERVTVNSGAPNLAEYLITIELGAAEKVLRLRPKGQRLMARIVATAQERRTPGLWSQVPLPFIQCLVHDPRPPILVGEPRAVTYSSLPLGETGISRASLLLPRQPLENGGQAAMPDIVGYHVWRATELAVLDHVIKAGAMARDKLAADEFLRLVRDERDPKMHSLLISSELDPLLDGDAKFAAALTAVFRADRPELIPADTGRVEIVLNASQVGFEFVTFTAVTADGVASPKNLKDLLRLVAVPNQPTLSQPTLRLIATDETGIFERTALVMAIVGNRRAFAKDVVRFFYHFGARPNDPDELYETLEPFQHLDRTSARRYIPEIDELIKSTLDIGHAEIFLIRLPQKGEDFNLTVDLRRNDGEPGDVFAEIASPRSPVQTLFFGTR